MELDWVRTEYLVQSGLYDWGLKKQHLLLYLGIGLVSLNLKEIGSFSCPIQFESVCSYAIYILYSFLLFVNVSLESLSSGRWKSLYLKVNSPQPRSKFFGHLFFLIALQYEYHRTMSCKK